MQYIGGNKFMAGFIYCAFVGFSFGIHDLFWNCNLSSSYGISKNITNVRIFFTIYAATLFLARPITGKLADKIGTSKVVLPGMIFLMTALFLLVKALSIYAFLAASVFYGIEFGSIQQILNALVVSLAPAEKRGAANATFAFTVVQFF